MKFKFICWLVVLACSLLPLAAYAQNGAAAPNDQNASTQAPAVPLDKAVTATCHQAWVLGGRTQEGFFAIVQELTEFSAQNRGVTIPDNQEAGARMGEWIRAQAMKDPNQLLYAIVDEAVQHQIAKGRATPTGTSAKGSTGTK